MTTRARYVGFAEESEYNPALPPEAVQHVDITGASLDVPNDPDILYGGGLSRSARTKRPGFYAPSGNFVYAFDISSIGRILRWTLGETVFTDGGVSPNTHEIFGTGLSILPSFTTRIGKDHLPTSDDFEHVFAGCVVNQLQVQVSNELAVATVDTVAARDLRDDIKEIGDLLLPEDFPIAFHEVTASIDGTDESIRVKSVQFTINNNSGADSGRSIGSRHPRRVVSGERVTTFQFDLYWESLAQLQKFWGGADGPAVGGGNEFPVKLTFAAADGQSLEVNFPRSYYTASREQPSGRDELVQQVTGRSLLDTQELLDAETEVETEVYCVLVNNEADYTA